MNNITQQSPAPLIFNKPRKYRYECTHSKIWLIKFNKNGEKKIRIVVSSENL